MACCAHRRLFSVGVANKSLIRRVAAARKFSCRRNGTVPVAPRAFAMQPLFLIPGAESRQRSMRHPLRRRARSRSGPRPKLLDDGLVPVEPLDVGPSFLFETFASASS